MAQPVIRPNEVAAWLADSLNRRVTYHRTTREAAEGIVRDGVRIERSVIGSYGQGFYTATMTDPAHGDVELALAIRLRQPMQGASDDVSEVVDEIGRGVTGQRVYALTPEVAAAIRRELLLRGYDGLIVLDAGGDGVDYVIALLAEAVRVVQP